MAVLFMEGFNHMNSTSLLQKKWNQAAGGSFSTSDPRFTGQQYFVASLTPLVYNVPSLSSAVVGCAIYNNFTYNGNNYVPIISAINNAESANQIVLRATLYGYLYITIANSVTAVGGIYSSRPLKCKTWHYIDWQFTVSDSSSSNDCIVYLDGEEVLNIPASNDLQGATGSTFEAIRFDSSSPVNYSDIYISSRTGSNPDALICPRVFTQFPDGNGNTSQWTPTSGSNYQCVDENSPNDDTDYVSSNNSGDQDLYIYTDVNNGYSIKAVQSLLYARKDDAGTQQVNPVARVSGTNYTGSAQTLNNTYNYYMKVYDQNPNTSATWTPSEVNSSEFGLKIV